MSDGIDERMICRLFDFWSDLACLRLTG